MNDDRVPRPAMSAGERPEPANAVRASLKVPGGRLAYETAGEGPALLFLHSVIADHRMWDREFSLYSTDHRAIRFDLRGFGRSLPATAEFSNVEDVSALLDHLRAHPAFLVGSSMGGALAIDVALRHPEMVRGLLLAAPGLSGGFEPPFDAEEMAAFEYDEKKSKEVSEAWSRADSAAAFDHLRRLWCAQLEGPSLELFRQMVGENAAEVFGDRSLRLAAASPAAAPRLPSLRVPTTVLVGDHDNPSSNVFAKRIAAAIPGARLVTVPGADHLINLSRPAAFDTALRAALAGST